MIEVGMIGEAITSPIIFLWKREKTLIVKTINLMRNLLILIILFQAMLVAAVGPPTWIPVPNLQYNMNIIGKIQLSPGVYSLNENDILGAFVGTECRGVASPFASLGGTLFLTIGSSVLSGETITFKIYLASTNEIVNANETIPFQNAGEVGTMASPFIFTFSILNNVVLQGITVSSGQNNCYNALQTITVAGNGTSFLIQNGGNATMIAGQRISLLPGTTVQSNGHLKAYITTTNSYCSSLPAYMTNSMGNEENRIQIKNGFSNFSIYPNPTSNNFTLELSREPQGSVTIVKIYNMMGTQILEKSLESGKIHEFSLSNQTPGVYLIKIVQNNEVGFGKIIRQ